MHVPDRTKSRCGIISCRTKVITISPRTSRHFATCGYTQQKTHFFSIMKDELKFTFEVSQPNSYEELTWVLRIMKQGIFWCVDIYHFQSLILFRAYFVFIDLITSYSFVSLDISLFGYFPVCLLHDCDNISSFVLTSDSALLSFYASILLLIFSSFLGLDRLLPILIFLLCCYHSFLYHLHF